MAITWHTAPIDVVATLTVTGGFPQPDAAVTFEIAGPDLTIQTPTNYVAQAAQNKAAVPLNSPIVFKITLSQVGYYQIRVSAVLSNPLGQVTIGPTTVNIGIGQSPSGTVG